jgi:hypothetical protein
MTTWRLLALTLSCLFPVLGEAQNLSLKWSKSWGDNSLQEVMATTVDENGNIFVASRFQGTVDFDPGGGSMTFSAGGLYDIAISKFDANGVFLWAKEIGGNGNDWPNDIAVDDSGSVYVTGTYSALMDLDPGPGVFNRFPVGNFDVFLIKLDNDGLFKWGASFGGNFQDYGYGLATDDHENRYACRKFRSQVAFDPGPGIATRIALGSGNAFVSRFDKNGNFEAVVSLGSGGDEYGRDVAIDNEKNVIVTGYFGDGPSDFDPGSGIANLFANSTDVFVCKLDSNFNYLWAKDFGGTFDEEAYRIEVDEQGNIYTTGVFGNVIDFDPGSGQSFVVAQGEEDIFLHRFKPNGDFDFVRTIGNNTEEYVYNMTRTASGDIYLTGSYRDSLDFDPGIGQYYLVSEDESEDIFLLKLDSLGNFGFALSLGGDEDDRGRSVSIIGDEVILGGAFESINMDTDPGTGIAPLSSAGGTDAFFLRLGDCQDFTVVADTAVCGSYVWTQDGMTYSRSGIFTDTLTNVANCDSVLALVLTVYPSDTVHLTQVACDSFFWTANSVNYTTSGLYSDTLMNRFGCDSVLTLDLIIEQSRVDTTRISACDIYQWPANNQNYSQSGIYSDTLLNAAGCDSLVVLDITLENSSGSVQTINSCERFVWPVTGDTLKNSGTYLDTLTNQSGCDSLLTLFLTIHSPTFSTVNESVCDSYFWPVNGNTYTSSGTYMDTLISASGCDSVLTLNLTVLSSSSSLETTTACDSYQWNGNTYTTSGTYVDTLVSASGCDSVLTLDLTVLSSSSSQETTTACDSYLWNGNTYTTSGTYVDTLINASGCDSVLTLNLTINSVLDTGVTISGSTLTANSASASYQWLDCDAGFAIILGETSQSFSPAANGTYAVEITENGCVDTSSCVLVTTIGNWESERPFSLSLFPNPTDGEFTIHFGKYTGEFSVIIADLAGREVYKAKYAGKDRATIELDEPSGIYLVSVFNGVHKATIRLQLK